MTLPPTHSQILSEKILSYLKEHPQKTRLEILAALSLLESEWIMALRKIRPQLVVKKAGKISTYEVKS